MSAAVARVISMEDHRQSAPQLENGFLRVALEIEDALLRKIDTFRHEKVVRAIIRKTYGYNKKEDDITISQISEMIGIHRNHVGKALRELEEMRVINPVRAGRYGLILGLNKRHHEWKKLDKTSEPSQPNQLHEATKTVDEAINQNGCSVQPNQLHEATKTVDLGNQNVAHNRQPQKTTPKDNPKGLRNLPIARHPPMPSPRSPNSGKPSATRRARPTQRQPSCASTPRLLALTTGLLR
ncbi:replication protein [Thauera humireducens]|uniref:replication protein n=1 Tax=Thauera humireducens TaxID=1134435 RepID=UPI00311E49EA